MRNPPAVDVLDAIHARRAVRSYDPLPVAEASLKMVLDAAVHAPSAMNMQPWVFSIVQDRERLLRWSTTAKKTLLERAETDEKAKQYAPLLRDESFCIFYDAATLVVIGANEPGPYTEADCWLAAENLMLAATHARLGTCCIGFAVPVLNTPEVKRELGLPETGVAVAPIILGHPRTRLPPSSRTEPRIAAWLR